MIDWTGDSRRAGRLRRDRALNAGDIFGTAPSEAGVAKTRGPKLTTLVSFTGADGAEPGASLIADAAGDLFGTASAGGADGDGTVFEIAKTRHGYSSAPATLVSFSGSDGATPDGSLITDAAGDLFGTTFQGGAEGDGTVFEIARTRHGYASAPKTLASFSGADGAGPDGSLIADAAGNLFGTTAEDGGDTLGTVFEIAKTRHGYASTPTTLASFEDDDGSTPNGSLIIDAAGDLFGTTQDGGANEVGTVFEIIRYPNGLYDGKPVTLVSFTGADGNDPQGDLITDAAGDLFGTTLAGGTDGDGTVFEIVKQGGFYATTPTTLVNFTGADGQAPAGSLIADAAGDLFGTTDEGGANGLGTVFEIAKTDGGYASAPTVLVNFTGPGGEYPYGSLIADAAGNLFGTAQSGGANGEGTVFEITHSGFVPPSAARTTPSSPAVAAFAQAMAATSGHGGMAGPINARVVNEDSRHLMWAAPRLAIA